MTFLKPAAMVADFCLMSAIVLSFCSSSYWSSLICSLICMLLFELIN